MPEKKKSKKSVKVADLSKNTKSTKKVKRGRFIHDPRLLGLFFIGVIGILSGLLLFNLIVHFGFVDTYDDFALTNAERSAANGSANSTAKFDGSSVENGVDLFAFSFEYPENLTLTKFIAEPGIGASETVLHVHEGIPEYNNNGATGLTVASFTFSEESKDDLVTELSGTNGTVTEIDFAGTKATQITQSDNVIKYIVFQNLGRVYSLALDTTKQAETEVIEKSVTLTKAAE